MFLISQKYFNERCYNMYNFKENSEHINAQRPVHPEPPHKPTPPEHPPKPDAPHPIEPPKPPVDKTITIIVNGVNKTLPKGTRQLSYSEVVTIAYGKFDEASHIIYTVAYSSGPKENLKGTLVKGQSVIVKEGMIFNVSRSDKS